MAGESVSTTKDISVSTINLKESSFSSSSNVSMNVSQETDLGLPSKDIDQVRDLLFGDYNREYDRHFRLVDRNVETLNVTLQRVIARVDRLEREKSELQERLRDQQLKTQLHIEELQRSFQEALRHQQREFDTKLDGLLATVTRMVDELDGSKLDQLQMAEMILDLGLRIKRNIQRQVSYELPQLVDDQQPL